MRRMRGLAAGCVMLCLAVLNVQGSPKPDAGTRESLFRSIQLKPLSLGGDLESFSRKVVWKNGGSSTDLEGDIQTGMIGFDLFRWMTLFGTFGQMEAALAGAGAESSRPVWSAGAGINFWQTDLVHPAFLSGRLSLRGGAEVTVAEFTDPLLGRGEWRENAFSGTLNYEVFVDRPDSLEQVPFSLLLYVGLVHSRVDGEGGHGANRWEFEADRLTGTAYGADLFVSSNLSVGIHLQHFESVNWRASVRYRF